MRRSLALATAATGVAVLVAGCGSGGSHGSGGSSGPDRESPATSSPSAGKTLAASPFRFSVQTCGALSAAQRTTFGTGARLGAVIRVTNVSGPVASVQFTLAFLRGPKADGQSYTGSNAPALARGKSELVEADMGPGLGAGRAGDTCTVTKEALLSPDTLTTLATYSG